MKTKMAFIVTGSVFVLFISIAMADMVKFDVEKQIIYIEDRVWNTLSMPDKEQLLERFANPEIFEEVSKADHWDVRLLYSGKKVGEIFPQKKKVGDYLSMTGSPINPARGEPQRYAHFRTEITNPTIGKS